MRAVRRWRENRRLGYLISCTFLLITLAATAILHKSAAAAGDPQEGFALQVSPSPLIGTLTPGHASTFDLQIRNPNSTPQQLKMGLKSFNISESTGQVQLGNDAPADIAQFVSFSKPNFTIEAGEIYTQHVIVDTPQSAGFTYSFAVTISQQNPAKAQQGSNAIRGSVADFTLLSVDRPGAVRKLELVDFKVSKHSYEYLPAKISVKLKNSGNTLVQPTGNIFIQRNSSDKTPLATIQLNKQGGYILPGSSRELNTEWSDGFPHYEIKTGDDNNPSSSANTTHQQQLTWSGGDISKLRFGRYVAKLVAVYNDGNVDVPINSEVTFWVIPWRIILGILVVIVILLIGVVSILRSSRKVIRRTGKHDAPPTS